MRPAAGLRDDLRGLRVLLVLAVANGLSCWLIALVVGGSGFVGEIPYEDPPFIVMDGERVPVARWLYELSFWHGASVFYSALLLPLVAALVTGPHALRWLLGLQSRSGSRYQRRME